MSKNKINLTSQQHPNSTQNSLCFSELRDNLVIMSDSSFRAVIAAQSINFDLMSARERESVEINYQDFVNSLNFPIQIYVKSEKVDITPYVNKLKALRTNQENMLLGALIDDYIDFINALAREANIMDKSFFVVIPYSIGEERAKIGSDSSQRGVLKNMVNDTAGTKAKIEVPANKYEAAKDEINSRVSVVLDGLRQIGVPAVRLKTKELGEMYYSIYNPDQALRQTIGDFSQYTTTYVSKGKGIAKHTNIGDVSV